MNRRLVAGIPSRLAIGLLMLMPAWAAGQDAPPVAPPSRSPTTAPGVATTLFVEAEPAFDLTQAQAWRDELMPLVEQVVGRRFAAAPAVRIVSREQLLESLVADGLLQILAIDPTVNPELAEMELTLDLLLVAPTLLGRYSLAERVIELPAGNTRPLMQAGGMEDDQLDAVMTLVMAHELAHAIHLQEIDVDAQLDAARTGDGIKAWNATLEGFGMLVQQRVADERGLEAVNERLVSLMDLGGADRPESRAAHRRFREIYRAGWDFLLAASEGDGPRVWSVLADPPVLYAQVRDPARYGRPVEMTMNPGRLFRGFDKILGGSTWAQAVTTSAPEVVGRTYQAIGEEVAGEVMVAMETAHTLLLSDRSRQIPQVRSVTLFELADAASGAVLIKHLGALRDLQFGRLRAVGAGQELLVQERGGEGIEGVDGDGAGIYRISLRQAEADLATPAIIEMTLAIVWRGEYAAQFVASGGPIDDATVATALNEVFERASSGAGLVPVVEPDETDPLIAAVKQMEPLLDGDDWTIEYLEVNRAVASRLLGQDVAARVIVEMALVSGCAGYADMGAAASVAAGPTPSVFVTLLELASDDAAASLATPLLDGAEVLLERMRAVVGIGIELRDAPDLTIGEGLVARGRAATLTLPNQVPGTMTVRVAQQGRFVVQVADFFGGFGDEDLQTYLEAIFAAVGTEE